MIKLTSEDKEVIKKYNISDEQLKQWEQEAREKIGDKKTGDELEKYIYRIIKSRITEVAEKKQYIAQKKKKKKVKAEEEEIKAIDIALDLLDTFTFKTFRDTEEVLVYKDGIYKYNGESVIKEEATKRLDDDFSTAKIQQIINYIKYNTFVDRTEFNNDVDVINVKNGLLNLKTGELKPHTPEFLSTVRIPVKYDPNADCPKIKKFLSEIVPENESPLLEEIAGYCLYKQYFIKKMIMLVGSGDNGKTTFLNLITALLGKENCSNIAIHELESNRFASSCLYGKLANIYPDLPATTLRTTGKLKALTGGDRIHAEKKFKNTFSFENYAKLLFSANTVPMTYDSTEAFFERWIIVEFPFRFKDNGGTKKVDKNLIKKLTTEEELSGFLNLALKGLKRLLENGRFSYNKTAEEIEEEYLRLSNTIYGFVSDWCEIDVEAWTTKEDLYNAYVKYCKEIKQTPYSANKFGRELPKIVTVTKMYPKVDGRQKEAWRGIKLKDDIFDEKEKIKKIANIANIANMVMEDIGDIGDIGDISNFNVLEKIKNVLNKGCKKLGSGICESCGKKKDELWLVKIGDKEGGYCFECIKEAVNEIKEGIRCVRCGSNLFVEPFRGKGFYYGKNLCVDCAYEITNQEQTQKEMEISKGKRIDVPPVFIDTSQDEDTDDLIDNDQKKESIDDILIKEAVRNEREERDEEDGQKLAKLAKKEGISNEKEYDIDDVIQNNRKKGSCEVCGKVTNLVPVVQNHKRVMVCRICREKVKQGQVVEGHHQPWNVGGVNLI